MSNVQAPARQSGFTLVEVLLAMAIFIIGFAMVASIPASATLIQRRYEQIVEGEIAAANSIEMVSTRKVFWPMYEHQYGGGPDRRHLFDGAIPKEVGTNRVNWWAYRVQQIPRGNTDSTNGGMAIALGFTPTDNQTPLNHPVGGTAYNGHRNGMCVDADMYGDFEDWVCNAYGWMCKTYWYDPVVKNVLGIDGKPLSSPDLVDNNGNGWGMCAGGIIYQTPAFLGMFDTNRNGVSHSEITVHDPGYGGGFAFIDPGDRTHFLKGRIHCGHNRLMPTDTYPAELTSYPTQVPLAQRRVFITLMLHDANCDLQKRQWTLTAAAHRFTPGDQWPEGADGWNFYEYCGPSFTGTLNPINLPSPLTKGDLSGMSLRGSSVTPPLPPAKLAKVMSMVANAYGLVDGRADADCPNAYTTIDSANNYDMAFNHGIIAARHPNTASLAWTTSVPQGNIAQATQVPVLMSLPAIIYDWDKSLIQVAYPKPYVPVAGQVDRRLKVGDRLMTEQGGLLLTVKSVRDENRPQYAAADRPFYQIVEVYPPLRESPLGGPTTTFPMIYQDSAPAPGRVGTYPAFYTANSRVSSGNTYPYWRLKQIFFAPAPTGQTSSSWIWSDQQTTGQFISANPNN